MKGVVKCWSNVLLFHFIVIVCIFSHTITITIHTCDIMKWLSLFSVDHTFRLRGSDSVCKLIEKQWNPRGSHCTFKGSQLLQAQPWTLIMTDISHVLYRQLICKNTCTQLNGSDTTIWLIANSISTACTV